MGEIGTVYAPKGSELFGVIVKDYMSSGYAFYLYKCTVKDIGSESEVSLQN